MPKLIDYPRASFHRAMEVAEAVDYLGGSCSWETCADKLGKRVSGAFQAVIGATTKHGLVVSKSNRLTTTDIFKSVKLAYTPEERMQALRHSFLLPPVYAKLYEQFKGREIPAQLLNKILMREYEVDDELASRVAKYFLEGAKFTEVLVDNKIIDFEATEHAALTISNREEALHEKGLNRIEKVKEQYSTFEIADGDLDTFSVHIFGPGMDTKLTISEDDDFLILEAVISKIRKKLQRN